MTGAVLDGHLFGEFEFFLMFFVSYIVKDIIVTIMSQQYIMKLSSMCTLCVQVLKSFCTHNTQTVHISYRVPTIEHDIPLK